MRGNDTFASNSVSITVQRVGQDDLTFVFDHEPKVKEVLQVANIPTNADCRCDWEIAELWFDLEDGDVLVVATKKITQG